MVLKQISYGTLQQVKITYNTMMNFIKSLFHTPLDLLTYMNLFSYETNLAIFYVFYTILLLIALMYFVTFTLGMFIKLLEWIDYYIGFDTIFSVIKWIIIGVIALSLVIFAAEMYKEHKKQDEIPTIPLFERETVNQEILIIQKVKYHFPNAKNSDLELIASEAKYFNLDLAWVYGIVARESSFRRHVVSGSNALGLFQIKKTTAKDATKIYSSYPEITRHSLLYNPRMNIEMGMAYIYMLWSEYYGYIDDLEKRKMVVTCAYNAGIGTIRNIFNGRSFYHACNVINQLSKQELEERLTYSLLKKGYKETFDYMYVVYDYKRMFSV